MLKRFNFDIMWFYKKLKTKVKGEYEMKKMGKIIFGCVPTILAVIIMYLLVIAACLVMGVKGIFVIGMESGDIQFLMDYILSVILESKAQLILNSSVMLMFILVFGIWYQKQFIKGKFSLMQIGDKAKSVFSWRIITYLIVLGAAIQVEVSILLDFILPIFPKTMENYTNLIESIGIGSTGGAWIYTVLLAPIAEELIFRGVTLKLEKKVLGFAVANVIQAVLFGIYHQNIVQFVYAFLLGMLLGYICHLYDSVLPAIVLHAAVNLFANILSATGLSTWYSTDIVKYVVLYVASSLVVASTFLLLREAKKRGHAGLKL